MRGSLLPVRLCLSVGSLDESAWEPDCNRHAPDENVDIEHYIKGIKYAAAIMWKYGRDSA